MEYPRFDGSQACAEIGLEIFFPPPDGYGNVLSREARKICASCDFLVPCGEWALHHAEPYGIYGGMTVADRHRIRKERNIIPDVMNVGDALAGVLSPQREREAS